MNVSVSTTGLLAFRQRITPKSSLRWFDPNGVAGATIGESGPIKKVNISPDGARIAVSRGLGVDSEIWTADVAQGLFSRVAPGTDPVWTPDGRALIVARNAPEAAVYRIAQGQADAEVMRGTSYPRDVSRDSRWLLVTTSPHDLNLVDLEKRQPTLRLAQLSPAVGHYDAQFSPDGKWISYTAQSAPGEMAVYVMHMPPTAERWQIAAHASLARWRPDGGALLFVSGTRILMSVDATRGFPTTLESRRMFEAPASILDYAVAPDGRLLVDLALEAIAQPLTIVSNWSSVIKN
jgi:Tol biopolymer transport system component